MKAKILLAAVFAASLASIQAQSPVAMPLNVAATVYVNPTAYKPFHGYANDLNDMTPVINANSKIQALTVNGSYIVQKVRNVLAPFGEKIPAGAKLGIANGWNGERYVGGHVVIINAAGEILQDSNGNDYDLTEIPFEYNDGTWVTTPNNVTLHYWTNSSVHFHADWQYSYDRDFEGLTFWDPAWVGTVTWNQDNSTSAFSVKGNALAGTFEVDLDCDVWVQNGGNDPVRLKHYHEYIQLSEGTKATVGCSLADGVYKQSFTLAAAGDYYVENSSYSPATDTTVFVSSGDGFLTGTVSASGTITDGPSFMDPFNEWDDFYGMYDWGYND